jgi:hypothetical protein
VSSCGFWAGGGGVSGPAFFSYASPEPPGFKDAPIPRPAFYGTELPMFLLRYDDVRSAADPRTMLLEFLQRTYEAAATLGRWDRENLEVADPHG